MKKLFALACGVLTLNPGLAAVQSPIGCHLFYDGSNTVQIKRNAGLGRICAGVPA